MSLVTSKFPSFAFISILLFACNNNTSHINEAISDEDTSIVTKNESIKTTALSIMTIGEIPFPFEILDNLYGGKIPFDEKYMNPISNASKYNQYNYQALNLGIYGADLAYIITYEQFQKIGPYIKITNKIADELNIDYAFDKTMLDKYEKYKSNKDSLVQIVYQSYEKIDKALKKDNRIGISSLVVAGSWLEGLYLATNTFSSANKTAENNSLYQKISEQKHSLLLVIKLLNLYKNDNFFAFLINDLQDITNDYSGAMEKPKMDPRQLNVINSKVSKLRDKIVNGY